MRFFIILSLLLLGAQPTFSQGFESFSTTSSQGNLDSLKKRILALETTLSEINNKIAEIKACGDAGQMYNGTACVNVVENDPLIETHAKQAMPSCGGTAGQLDKAQYYNGGSWSCKTF